MEEHRAAAPEESRSTETLDLRWGNDVAQSSVGAGQVTGSCVCVSVGLCVRYW